jgi:hypothetical protein
VGFIPLNGLPGGPALFIHNIKNFHNLPQIFNAFRAILPAKSLFVMAP